MPEAIVSRILRLPGYGVYACEADETAGTLWVWVRQTAPEPYYVCGGGAGSRSGTSTAGRSGGSGICPGVLGGAGTQTRDAGPVLRRGPAAASAARRARGLCRHVGTLRAEPAGPPAPRAPRLRQVPRPAACERRRRRDAAGRILPQGRRGPRPAPGQALVAPAPLGAPRTGGAAPGQGTAGPQPPARQGVPAQGTARSSLGLHL